MASRSIDDVASRSLDSGFGIEESLQRDEDRRRPASDREDLEASDDDDGAVIGGESVERLTHGIRPVGVRSDGRSSNTTGIVGKSLRRSGSAINRLTLFRCHRDGMTEELPDLAPEFNRSRGMDEQDWNDVDPTRSTLE